MTRGQHVRLEIFGESVNKGLWCLLKRGFFSYEILILFNFIQLKKHGFVKIDALEPSEAMTNEAKKDEVYNHYCMEFLTASPTSLSAGMFLH